VLFHDNVINRTRPKINNYLQKSNYT